MALAENLTFCDHLWDGFDLLCKRTEIGLVSCKEVARFFRKYAQLEDEYSKSLQKLVTKFSPLEEKGTLGRAWSNLLAYAEAQAEVHGALASGIESGVESQVTLMLKDMEVRRKQIVTDGVKVRLELKDSLDALKKAQTRYEKQCRDAEQTKLEFLAAIEVDQDQATTAVAKLEKKLYRAEAEAAVSEEEYKAAIVSSNDIQTQYTNEKYPKILSDLENFENTRIKLLRANINNYVALVRDIPHRLEFEVRKLGDTVYSVDQNADIQTFIRENKTPKVIPPVFQFEAYVEGKLEHITTNKKQWTTFFSKNKKVDDLSLSPNPPISPPLPVNLSPSSPPTNTKSTFITTAKSFLPSSNNNNNATGSSTLNFGVTLDELMSRQKEEFPDLEVPKVLFILAKCIIQLKGYLNEGIFRVPAIVGEVQSLKRQLDEGNFNLSHINDVRTPAAVLKLWIRDLPLPLIPTAQYDYCVENPDLGLAVLYKIPVHHAKLIEWLIHFLQAFSTPQFVVQSKMGIANLAMVFAPAILRCPSDDPSVMLKSVTQEKKFVENLLSFMPPANDPSLGLPFEPSDITYINEYLATLSSSPDSKNRVASPNLNVSTVPSSMTTSGVFSISFSNPSPLLSPSVPTLSPTPNTNTTSTPQPITTSTTSTTTTTTTSTSGWKSANVAPSLQDSGDSNVVKEDSESKPNWAHASVHKETSSTSNNNNNNNNNNNMSTSFNSNNEESNPFGNMDGAKPRNPRTTTTTAQPIPSTETTSGKFVAYSAPVSTGVKPDENTTSTANSGWVRVKSTRPTTTSLQSTLASPPPSQGQGWVASKVNHNNDSENNNT